MASDGHIGPMPARPTSNQAFKLLPHVWTLLKPQASILTLALGLLVLNRISGLVLPASTKYLVDDVIGQRRIQLLTPVLLSVLIATVVQAGSSFGLTRLLSASSYRMISELRLRVHAHMMRLPMTFYEANKTGALISRIMSDVDGVRNLLGTGLIDLMGGTMTAILAVIVLLRISLSMTLVAVLTVAVFGAGLNIAFKKIRPIFRARPRIAAEVTGRLAESLSGIRIIKGYHAEAREEGVFATGLNKLLQNLVRALTATSLVTFSATTLLGCVSATMMFLGTRAILSNRMSLGQFITYMLFLGLLVAPVSQIVTMGPQITEALAGLERVREVLSERRETEDLRRTKNPDHIDGHIEFEAVSFAYEPGNVILEDLSFAADSSSVTALVGPSGAGKSTVIGLVAAFYTPTQGRILLDGLDLGEVSLDFYRSQLGLVLQESFLFDGTIRENVAFGRPGAADEEILAACRAARVDEFAELLNEKYDTVVGERGLKLSGGQKQRVSIARAILANPRILILDEATSSVDSKAEALIQQGLEDLMRGRTTFVIAHRLSTIRRADQILVLERGRIIERGTHESLFAMRGRYYELYTIQHEVESNLFLAPGECIADSEVARVPAMDSARANQNESAVGDPISLIRGRSI